MLSFSFYRLFRGLLVHGRGKWTKRPVLRWPTIRQQRAFETVCNPSEKIMLWAGSKPLKCHHLFLNPCRKLVVAQCTSEAFGVFANLIVTSVDWPELVMLTSRMNVYLINVSRAHNQLLESSVWKKGIRLLYNCRDAGASRNWLECWRQRGRDSGRLRRGTSYVSVEKIKIGELVRDTVCSKTIEWERVNRGLNTPVNICSVIEYRIYAKLEALRIWQICFLCFLLIFVW